jgi:UDP-glucuronate decarboxylase
MYTNNIENVILITGGAGFIGSNLVNYLLNNDFKKVICLDNLSSGIEANIEPFKSHKAFSFIRGDVCNEFDIPCDVTINLACPASPPFYQQDPLSTISTCYDGTQNCLKNALKYNSKVLHASTSEIYGDPLLHPQNESYRGNVNPFGPRACYDEGKRIAETLCYEYQSKHGLDIAVFRIFNTYGPRMRLEDGRVVTNIMSNFLKNYPIQIYGDGLQTRSFCYIDDLIAGFIKVLTSDIHLDYPINIGNPSETTILDLTKTFSKLVNKDLEIQFKELPIDDPKKRQPDISKMEMLFDWKPKVSLENGLKEMLSFYQNKQT